MTSSTLLAQIVLNGLNISAIYIMMALGFTLMFGIMRIINFAHGEFAMAGGYLTYFLFTQMGVPYLLALPISALVVAIVALVIERTVYRPFYQKELQGMIGTLGLSIAMTYAAVIIFGTYQKSIPPTFNQVFMFGPIALPAERLVVLMIAVLTLFSFYAFIRYTRIGLAMRVVAQDLAMAEAQGINARKVYRVAFLLATGLAALAGGLLGQLYALSPFMGVTPLVKSFIVVILGGLGSIPGAAVGGVILGMSESFLNTFYDASIAQFVSFGAICVLLILRPQGLLGRRVG